MPCPVARRAPRAGQRPRPRPEEGRPGGGRRGSSDPPLEAPCSLPRDRDVTLGLGLLRSLREVKSLSGGAVYLDPPKPCSGYRGICLGFGPGFVQPQVGVGGRGRIGSLRTPVFLSLDSPLPVALGAGGMGHAPVTSLWVVGGPLVEGDPSR